MKKFLLGTIIAFLGVVACFPLKSMAASRGEAGYVFYTDANGANPSTDSTGKTFAFTITDASNKKVSIEAAGTGISGSITIPETVSDGVDEYTVNTFVAFNSSTLRTGAFSGCSNLTKVTLSNNIAEIPAETFYNSGLQEVVFPTTSVTVGNEAFSHSQLAQVTIPSTVSLSGSSIFESCLNLTRVTFGEGITNIPSKLFMDCFNLSQVNFPESLVTIGDKAFSNTKVSDLTFGSHLQSIGANAFEFCNQIDTVVLPSSLQTIGAKAFYADRYIRNVILCVSGSSLTSVQADIFDSCSSLCGEENEMLSLTPDGCVVLLAEDGTTNCGSGSAFDKYSVISPALISGTIPATFYGASLNVDGDTSDLKVTYSVDRSAVTPKLVCTFSSTQGVKNVEASAGSSGAAGGVGVCSFELTGLTEFRSTGSCTPVLCTFEYGMPDPQEGVQEDGIEIIDILNELRAKLELAKALGGKQTVVWDKGNCLSYDIMETLQSNPDITLVYNYSYQGVNYKVTLSGKNVKAYPDILWYGPIYLYKVYGGSAVAGDAIIR